MTPQQIATLVGQLALLSDAVSRDCHNALQTQRAQMRLLAMRASLKEAEVQVMQDLAGRVSNIAARLVAVVRMYEGWEAALILDGAAWDTKDGLPQLTESLYEHWMRIQNERNQVMAEVDHVLYRPMSEAPKDGTPVLLKLRNEGVPDHWKGVVFVGRNPGLTDDGDLGWVIAAPVGHGGFCDDQFVGWRSI